ncbi:hypothetical protein LZG00_17215 [Rhodobacteraceae bacterium LMO-12]|nr:hypothetical protein [Rhodobacteraceae bacterium LMO-JJ12]
MIELEEALDTLKDRLGQGGRAAEIVTDTADEYELNPILLRRKFVEKFAVSPEAYVPSTSLATLSRRKARKEAHSWAWQSHSQLQTLSMSMDEYQAYQTGKSEWVEQQVKEHHLGAIFVENGNEYVFAGLSSSRAIKAIPVDDGEPTEKGAHLYKVVFQDGVKPFAWTTMQEVQPHISGVLWRLGNPNLEFSTEQKAYDWLHERTVVRAIDDLA